MKPVLAFASQGVPGSNPGRVNIEKMDFSLLTRVWGSIKSQSSISDGRNIKKKDI